MNINDPRVYVDYVCTRGFVSTPADDKRVYGHVSELGIPCNTLSHDSFAFFLFIANSRRVSPTRARIAGRLQPDERIDNVYYGRAHSIRNNNDLSAIRCKMSARSRGITLSLRVLQRPMKTFHAPDFGFMISRNFFFRSSDKTRDRIIPRQRSNL